MTDFTASMPCMRWASSPEVNWRKNFSGRVSSRPHRAASTLMSSREEILMMATLRMVERAAMVKLVTIMTWVTVTSPFLSRMGRMSRKMVSVMIGVTSGMKPAKKLTRIRVR